MAYEVREFAVTIPAGTPRPAPVTTDIAFPERVVTGVNWRVPPGPSGLMGWMLTMGGVQVLPVNPGAFVVADDAAEQWPLSGQPDSGAWQVTGYNTGVYPHTVFLTFLLDLPIAAQPSAVAAAAAATPVPVLSGTVSTAG